MRGCQEILCLKVLGDSVSLPIEEEWMTCSQVSQRSIRLSFSTFMDCIFFLMASILTCLTWAFGEEQKGTKSCIQDIYRQVSMDSWACRGRILLLALLPTAGWHAVAAACWLQLAGMQWLDRQDAAR